MTYTTYGTVGSILAAIAGAYYIVTILQGKTKPQRVTWFGWTLVAVLGAWSARDGGAGAGAWVPITLAVTLGLTFLLSLMPKFGKTGGHKGDYLFAALSAAAIIVWQAAKLSPSFAATAAIITDLWFSWLTLRGAWQFPDTEALGPWIVGIAAELLGVMALQNYSYAAAAFPVYILIINCEITAALVFRKLQKRLPTLRFT